MVDLLAFAPHPDDAELYCSGTLAKAKLHGHSTGIIDLTRGELSSRGTLETRARETARASEILQLQLRENLDIPDGAISSSAENRLKIIRILREHRPRTVFLPYHIDRHPDHERAASLVKESLFYSGLARIFVEGVDGTPLPPFRPARAFHYMMEHSFAPSFIVDVSDTFPLRLAAIEAYATQFNTLDESLGPVTFVSSPAFLDFIVARARQLGFSIGATYGEGFMNLQIPEMHINGIV